VTLAVFHDFPDLENGRTKFHDFPGRVVTLNDDDYGGGSVDEDSFTHWQVKIFND